MENYENQTKGILYERAQEMAAKDKEIYKLKEENIEVEKIYLDEREKQQKREEKHLRELTRLFQEFEALRKELRDLKLANQQDLDREKSRHARQMGEVLEKLGEM
jgi:hypothetical protein